MKKWILLIVFLVIGSSIVIADQQSMLAEQLEIRQASLDVLATTLEINMDATVSYVTSLLGDTAELTSLEADFHAKREDARGAKTHDELNKGIQEMGTILNSFNQKADALIKSKGGNPLTWLGKIGEETKARQSEIDNAKAAYWTVNQKNTLSLFDETMTQLEDVRVYIESSGWDMTQINQKFDELKGLRGDLETALGKENDGEVLKVQIQILGVSLQLVQVGGPGLDWAYNAQPISFWLDVSQTALDQINKLIDNLQKLNVDVTTLRSIYDRGEHDEAALQSAYDSKNAASARMALTNLGKDWQDLITELDRISKSGQVPAAYQQQVQNTVKALQSSQQQIAQDAGKIK